MTEEFELNIKISFVMNTLVQADNEDDAKDIPLGEIFEDYSRSELLEFILDGDVEYQE